MKITFYLIYYIIEFAVAKLLLLLVLHCKIRVLILTHCREQVKDLHQIMGTVNTNRLQKVSKESKKVMDINTTVKSIRTIESENGVVYRVEFADSFPAIIKAEDKYVEGEANYISFQPRVLIAQVLNLVEGADILYTRRHEAAIRTGSADFGAAELSAILRGANITIGRIKFAAGEEYSVGDETHTHEYAGYNTQIISIKVTPRVAKQMDSLLDSVLSV